MADYLQKRNKPNTSFSLVGIAWSMAMSIGLHREFGLQATTPFAMEVRRRAWWALYTFVSSAQLTLGRPPASLIGVNVRSPLNLDDNSLAVDMDELPLPKDSPTSASCLIAQIPLARIANKVQAALLTRRVPMTSVAEHLDGEVESWLNNLPWYLKPEETHETHVQLSKWLLLWRAYHLRIVLNRPFLFEAIANKSELNTSNAQIQTCVEMAGICIESIEAFLHQNSSWTRGFAWYATYWLISASLVHAICFSYAPQSTAAHGWTSRLTQAIEMLRKFDFAHCGAGQARRILERIHGTTATCPRFLLFEH